MKIRTGTVGINKELILPDFAHQINLVESILYDCIAYGAEQEEENKSNSLRIRVLRDLLYTTSIFPKPPDIHERNDHKPGSGDSTAEFIHFALRRDTPNKDINTKSDNTQEKHCNGASICHDGKR